MRTLILTFMLLSFYSFCQEKRLALVIGNSNYKTAPLKNPVKDAILMKQTFESLGFDVLLDTNISTRGDFLKCIRNYQNKRENYTVGFLYYAGHGVQIDGKNYLLATQETYNSKNDVQDFGVPVETILNETIDLAENEVNVIILDACRNNPFEQNWLGASRSLSKGSGLAELSSTGNLIAFSTAAGSTASDGLDKSLNSIYCLSLSKNMQIENLDLDNVFRNVRKEVRELSDGHQMPAYYNQLEGHDFYLRKSSFTDKILMIDSLIDSENYQLALENTTEVLVKSPNNQQALLRKGQISYLINGMDYDGMDIKKAVELYPLEPECYEYLARYHSYIEKNNEAIEAINRAIKLDSLNADYFNWRAIFNEELNKDNEALSDYSKAIELDSKNPQRLTNRGLFYRDYLQEYDNALNDFSYAIKLNPLSINNLYERGVLYKDYLNNNNKAFEDFQQIISMDPNNLDAIVYIGLIYEEQGKIDLAITQYNKGIAREKEDPESAALCYTNRAMLYSQQGNIDDAQKDYSKAIELNPSYSELYSNRGIFYQDIIQDYNNALIDFSLAIELNQNSIDYWYSRGVLYQEYLKDYEKAIEDYNHVLTIDPSNINAINCIGLVYLNQGKKELAIAQYEKGIELEVLSPESAAFCYRNRAEIIKDMGKLEDALNDYSKAIELDPKNPARYTDRGYFYQDYMQEYSKAQNDFSLAIELDRNLTQTWYNRGVFYAEYLKNYQKAIEDFQQVLVIDSSNVDAINYIGTLYEELNLHDKAIAQYDKGIVLEKMAPESAAFCFGNRAAIFAKQGKFDEALNDYSKAITLDANNLARYIARGAFYRDYLLDYNNALIDFSLAIELNPESSDSYLVRGSLYQDYLKNVENALKDFRKVLSIDTSNFDATISLGVIYMNNGELEDALKHFNNALLYGNNSKEKLSEALSYRAYVYAELGEFELAKKDFNESVDADPENAFRYSERGQFYDLYINNLNESLSNYTKAIELDPKNASFLLTRSKVYFKLSNRKSQMKDLERAIKLDPETPDYACEWALYLGVYGELEKAIKEIDNCYYLDTTFSNPLLYKAKILISKGDNESAEHVLNKVIFLSPFDPEPYFLKARLFELQGSIHKATYNYSMALSKLQDGNYYLTDDFGNDLEPSEIHAYIGRYFEKIGETDLMCEQFSKSLELLKNENRYRFKGLKKEMEDKVIQCK
jgi:tetratricopeptide (TPR) repeat protein